jgi:cytochrome P450
LSTWATHRNKAIFGEDAEVFRPERWLEATGETLQRMERTIEVLFGSGRYGCLGKSVAFVELDKFFFEVILNSSRFGRLSWLIQIASYSLVLISH